MTNIVKSSDGKYYAIIDSVATEVKAGTSFVFSPCDDELSIETDNSSASVFAANDTASVFSSHESASVYSNSASVYSDAA